MPPKPVPAQGNLDDFVHQAPNILNNLVAGVNTLQATTQQMQHDLNAQGQQVNAALVQLDTDSLTQSVARLGIPAARPFNSRQPHKWVSDLLNEFTRWSQPHADAMTNNPITDVNAVPPTAIWANTLDPNYLVSREVYLYLHAQMPITKQTALDAAMDKLSFDRGDDLLKFSAYHAWLIIIEHKEELAASHLARLRTIRCPSEQHLVAFMSEVRLARADYLASIPAAQRVFRDHDVSAIVQENCPPTVKTIIDQQLFSTPLTACVVVRAQMSARRNHFHFFIFFGGALFCIALSRSDLLAL